MLNLQLEAENKRLKSSQHAIVPAKCKSGCGLWCAGAMCGCCIEEHEETYKPNQNGVNNEAANQNGINNEAANQNGINNEAVTVEISGV